MLASSEYENATLHHFGINFLLKPRPYCDFVAKNCNKSTVILGDCVLNEKFHVEKSDIHKIIDDYISKDYILQNNNIFLSKNNFLIF